jgi:hypothetical protein
MSRRLLGLSFVAAACGTSDPGDPQDGLGSTREAVSQPTLSVTFRDTEHRILGVDRDGTVYGTAYSDSSSGLWVSTDGRTWTRRASKPVAGTMSYLAPLSDGTLLVEAKLSGSQSLWRSTDHGATWKQVLVTGQYRMLQTHSIRELDGTVYYGEYQSFTSGAVPLHLWASTDRGATFSARYVFEGRRHVHSLVADPTRHELWALLGDGAPAGLLRSRDQGRSFAVVVKGQNGVAADAIVTANGLLFGTDTFTTTFPPRVALVAPDGSESFLATLPTLSYSIFALKGGGILLGTTREPSGLSAAVDAAYLLASPDGFDWRELARYPVDDLTDYGRADVHWQLPSGEVIIELANVDGMRTRGGYQLARVTFGEPPRTLSFQYGVLPSATYAGGRDAWISEDAPTTRYGTSTRARVDGDEPDGSGHDAYALLGWDVTSVPPGSVVSSAEITLQVTDPGSRPFEVYPLLWEWSESQVTWTEAAISVPWQLPGAKGAADRSPTVIGTIAPTVSGSYAVALNSAGVALVQSWVDHPSTNHGFIIANATNANGVNWVTRDSSQTSQRPKLTITF